MFALCGQSMLHGVQYKLAIGQHGTKQPYMLPHLNMVVTIHYTVVV